MNLQTSQQMTQQVHDDSAMSEVLVCDELDHSDFITKQTEEVDVVYNIQEYEHQEFNPTQQTEEEYN